MDQDQERGSGQRRNTLPDHDRRTDQLGWSERAWQYLIQSWDWASDGPTSRPTRTAATAVKWRSATSTECPASTPACPTAAVFSGSASRYRAPAHNAFCEPLVPIFRCRCDSHPGLYSEKRPWANVGGHQDDCLHPLRRRKADGLRRSHERPGTEKKPALLAMAWGRKASCDCDTCKKCRHRQYMRRYYQSKSIEERRRMFISGRNPDRVIKAELIRSRKRRADQEYQRRKKANDIAYRAILNGQLHKQPCVVCESTEQVDAHHDNYDKPLKVKWLCRIHHAEEHNPKLWA